MSTYIYLQCLSHDPVLTSAGESGQHLYDLPQIREDIANRDELVAMINRAEGLGMDAWPEEWMRRNTIHFMVNHPKCKLGIQDEYYRSYGLTAEVE